MMQAIALVLIALAVGAMSAPAIAQVPLGEFKVKDADTNGDGGASREELIVMMIATVMPQLEATARQADRNGNGTFELEEMFPPDASAEAMKAAVEQFELLDTDGDRIVSMDAMFADMREQARIQLGPYVSDLLERKDANNDGLLTDEEFSTANGE